MAATRHHVSLALYICALFAPVLSGCAQGRPIKATALSDKYLMPHVDNAQTIDLSKLAVSSVSSELIDRGDVLEVTIESGYEREHANNTVPVRVGEDGATQIPLVGRVQVAGLELTGAEEAIRAAGVERGVFRNPNVTVVMKQQRVNRVTVIGAVQKPGTYELPRGSSALLAAIVEAEGFTEDAGTEIEIRRPALRNEAVPVAPESGDRVASGPNQLTSFEQQAAPVRSASNVRIDLIAATKEGTSKSNYYLDDGDVVMVEKRDPPPVIVIGLVGKPGQFKLPANKDLHLLDAIGLAGGQATPYVDKVNVIRKMPGSHEPMVIRVSLREAKTKGKGNLRLGPGDIVSVEQSPLNFGMDIFKTIVPFTIAPTMTFLK